MSTVVAPLTAAPMGASMASSSSSNPNSNSNTNANGTRPSPASSVQDNSRRGTPSSTSARKDRSPYQQPSRPSPRASHPYPAATSSVAFDGASSSVARRRSDSSVRRSPAGVGAGGISANTSSERETIEYRNGSINGRRRSPLGREVQTMTSREADNGPGRRLSGEHIPSPSSHEVPVKREPSASPNLNLKTRPAQPLPSITTSSSASTYGSVTSTMATTTSTATATTAAASKAAKPTTSNATRERSSSMRHRPGKLDVGLANTVVPPRGAMTAREAPGAASSMHDIGLACLSPGFQPQDAMMEQKVARSVAVREQQRLLIERRLQKGANNSANTLLPSREREQPQSTAANGPGPAIVEPAGHEAGGNAGNVVQLFAPLKASGNNANSGGSGSGRRRAPPNLSINPASANQFSHERVIQSAPLNRSFPGRAAEPNVDADNRLRAFARHEQTQPSAQSLRPIRGTSPGRGPTQHIVHAPATQTNNRLPPITDVFNDISNRPNSGNEPSGRSPPTGHPQQRTRDFRSAEEAVQELTSGREELLPRLVYAGATNPPREHNYLRGHRRNVSAASRLSSGAVMNSSPLSHGARPPSTLRRRTRTEYELEQGEAPLGAGPEAPHVLPHHPHPGHNGASSSRYRLSLPSMAPAATTATATAGPATTSAPGVPPHHHHHHHHHHPVPPQQQQQQQQPGAPANVSPQTAYSAHAAQMGGAGRKQQQYASPGSQPMAFAPPNASAESPDGGFGAQAQAQISQRKKEEFLALMSRAWDLFHSA